MIRGLTWLWHSLKVPERTKIFCEKWKESQTFKAKVLGTTGLVVGGAIYLRREIYIKAKGIDKLETILSEEEFKRRDENGLFDRYLAIWQDDLTRPLAILSPKRAERVQKILKQLAKSNMGLLYTDEIDDFSNQIDPESGLKQPNHYVVLNGRNLKRFELRPEESTATIGVGWRVHELNTELLKKGYYLPLEQVHNSQTIFDLINQDEGRLRHPVFTFFKSLVGDMLVFLPNGEAQIGTHNVGPGINLKELFFGSNANIGIAAEVEVKLMKIPANYVRLNIELNKNITSTQIYYLLQNIQDLKQNRYLTELKITPKNKTIILTMDKSNPVSDEESLLRKWKHKLLKGGFLEANIIESLQVDRHFPAEYYSNPSPKSGYNFDASFLLQNQEITKQCLELLSYLKDQSSHYNDYSAVFDISSKVINLSLNYNDNSEELLRYNEFINTLKVSPAYLPPPQESPFAVLLKVPLFKYLADVFQKQDELKQNGSQFFQKLINTKKQHPKQASPLIQEDPRKSFVKKLINYIINEEGQLIACSNEEIKGYFKQQDLFLNYGLHGSRLQLDLYKFFDKANILYNPIYHQKQIFANRPKTV